MVFLVSKLSRDAKTQRFSESIKVNICLNYANFSRADGECGCRRPALDRKVEIHFVGDAGMTKFKVLMAAVAASFAAACQAIPDDMSVAEYCADESRANKDVCKINVELDGQKRALAETNLTVSQARAVADAATSKADEALSVANAALAREDDVYCETRTMNRTSVGTCSPGYKVVSCTQTRYTTRAGGLSFIREIDDEKCRFNSQVLEVQVRCCMAGASARPVQAPISQPVADKPADLRAS